MKRTPLILLLALAALASYPSDAVAQYRGPYLQQATPTSMTVVWRELVPTPGAICWGTAPDALDQRRTAPAATDQVFVLDGLTPATRYWYVVGEDCTTSDVAPDGWTFRTAPRIGSTEPVRLWVVGDSGNGSARQGAVRDAMLEYTADRRPDLFLHMGDMAYGDGLNFEFDAYFFGMYREILTWLPTWPTMGNHEGHTSDSATESGPYYDAYVLPRRGEAGGVPSGTEAYYSFDHGNAHYIVLESYEIDRDPSGVMAQWLREDLAATDQTWIIAFWHHPPYTKGSHDSDGETQLIEMRENILPILESAGVDLVLAGHSHIYERSWLLHGAYDTPTTADGYVLDRGDGNPTGDGAYRTAGAGSVYVVAGHGGAGVGQSGVHPVMVAIEADHGSCIVDIEGDTLTLRNLRWDGEVTDVFRIDKRDGLFLVSPSGGERVFPGDVLDVTWTSRGAGDAVHVDYTLDGVTWYRAADTTDNDGHFAWTTPVWPTDAARLRIVDAADAARVDASAPFSLQAVSTRELIPSGSTWEYRDDDVVPDPAWRQSIGGWPSGRGELGYGDGDEATVLRDEDPNIPTVYFRTAVTVPAGAVAATFDVTYDDGVVVWLDDVEVGRANVEAIAHDFYASETSSDDALARFGVDGISAGERVVAAIVKQRSADSSDLSFDLRMTVDVAVDITPVPPTDPEVTEDVGGEDAGTDTGVPDTGVPDTGVPDTDVPDAVPVADAGGVDVPAPSEDAVGEDAATNVDTSGGRPDADEDDDGPTTGGPGGCASTSATNLPASAVLALLALLALATRPRRRAGSASSHVARATA